jgi:hypothetical protein
LASYKDKILEIDENYHRWLFREIEPMVEFPTPWMLEENYYLNEQGIRCDEFSEIEKKDHILFAGCEYTLPIDVDIESSWAFNIYRYFFGRNGTFRNLSYPGADPEKIVSNIMKYVDIYGAPKKMFILMPEIIRSYGYWEEGKVFKPKMYRQLKSDPLEEHNEMAKPNDVPFNKLALSYIRWCRALESYCKAIGSELSWSTWDKETSEVLSYVGFDNFFETSRDLTTQSEMYSHFVKNIKENNGI